MKNTLLILSFLLISLVPTIAQNDAFFIMPVEDVFYISGKGTVVTGNIESGTLKIGDKVEIIGNNNQPKTATITSIDKFRKMVDIANAGENVGLVLKGIEKTDVSRGMVLAAPEKMKAYSQFEAEVNFLKEEEGGRTGPITSTFKPMLKIWKIDYSGEINMTESVKMILPGDNIKLIIKLTTPVALKTDLSFSIGENGKKIGSGKIIELIE